MAVYIEREQKTVPGMTGKAKELLKEHNINPETIVITQNGTLITEEDNISEDDEIKIISVVSGG